MSDITVGTLATAFIGNDRLALRVTAVSPSGKTFYCCRLKRRGKTWKEIPDDKKLQVRKDDEGNWRLWGQGPNWLVEFGRADEYQDPSI